MKPVGGVKPDCCMGTERDWKPIVSVGELDESLGLLKFMRDVG